MVQLPFLECLLVTIMTFPVQIALCIPLALGASFTFSVTLNQLWHLAALLCDASLSGIYCLMSVFLAALMCDAFPLPVFLSGVW